VELVPQPAELVTQIDWSELSPRQIMELFVCSRCGECQNWCPVYQENKQEDFLPRAKIRMAKKLMHNQKSLISRLFKREISEKMIREFAESLYQCSVCGQCHYVCPNNIDTIELWEALRAVLVHNGYGPYENQQLLVTSINNNDNPWQQSRATRDRWAVRAVKEKRIAQIKSFTKEKPPVLFYVGCTAAYDMNVKEVAINTSYILQAAGVNFGILGNSEKCCGSTLLRVGARSEFEKVAKANIGQFHQMGIKTLVASCSGCYKTIKQDYSKLADLDFEVLHISEYILRLQKEGKLKYNSPLPIKVTYHDPCHLGRHNGLYEAPREVLRSIPGVELVEMERSGVNARCCGAGGGLKAGFPEIQAKISVTRIKEAEATGATNLISACPFCYQGLQLGINAANSKLVMRDLTELVVEACREVEHDSNLHR